jgi:hypothetical protein
MSNGATGSLNAAWAYGGGDSEACAGIAVEACTKLTKAEGLIGGYFAFSHSATSGDEHSSSSTVTFSFEYTTSDDIEKAGARSDMFLTPSLNVKFSKSAEITFNKTSCEPSNQRLEHATSLFVFVFS